MCQNGGFKSVGAQFTCFTSTGTGTKVPKLTHTHAGRADGAADRGTALLALLGLYQVQTYQSSHTLARTHKHTHTHTYAHTQDAQMERLTEALLYLLY